MSKKMTQKNHELRKLILGQARTQVKKMGLIAVEIDEPPLVSIPTIFTRFNHGGDTWYFSAKKKLSPKECKLAIDLNLIFDLLRATFTSDRLSGPLFDNCTHQQGCDFDGAMQTALDAKLKL